MKTIVAIPLCAGLALSQAVTRTETKTTWNGTLVDAACQTTQTQRTTQDATKSETTTTETVRCPVTPQSSAFGIITADGRFIRFDNPSNTRVIEVVRSQKMADSSQPLRVQVVGISSGDTAVVETVTLQAQPQPVSTAERIVTTSELAFDVRLGGDRGRLIVGDKGISFQNISDARRSKTWTFAQIQEFKRESNNKVMIEPFDDDEYEFQLDGPALADTTYKMIADRIVAARAR